MRTEEEAVSRLRALAPSAGRLTQRISQKIAFSVHQGSGGWGPSLLATGLVSRPLPHRSLSASNVIRQRKEAALIWDSAWSPPSDTWDGKKWEPGGRHQALLSHLFSGQCHLRAMFGAGHGKAGAVRREMQTLPGKPGSPLNGLGGWGAWGYSTSSYVLGTLALEVALCQSASFPIAQSGARGGGRRCRGVE